MLVQAELLLIYKQDDVVIKYDIALKNITKNYGYICRKIKQQSYLPAILIDHSAQTVPPVALK